MRDTNRKERIRQLTAIAIRLFLERGINETSIDDITQAAGVAKGSFYRYFEDKDALVASMLQPIAGEVLGALRRCGDEVERALTPEAMFDAYRTLGERLVAAILGNTEVVRLYLQESRGASVGPRAKIVALSDAVGKAAIKVTVKAHHHGLLRAIHPSVSALAVVGAAERLLLALFTGEEVGNPLELPDGLITLVLYGLKQPNA